METALKRTSKKPWGKWTSLAKILSQFWPAWLVESGRFPVGCKEGLRCLTRSGQGDGMMDEMMVATQMEFREICRLFLMIHRYERMFLTTAVSLITCMFEANNAIVFTLSRRVEDSYRVQQRPVHLQTTEEQARPGIVGQKAQIIGERKGNFQVDMRNP